MNDYARLVELCETHLREGRGQLIAQSFSNLKVADISREYRLPLANICRRANLLALGLKILNPLTGPERTFEPNQKELAEYAVLLERSGAVNEALGILKDIDSSQVLDAPLYRAFCHFKSWDYGAAIPDLKTYIENQSSPYWKLVGQVNLAASYVSERQFDLAGEQLSKNILHAEQHGFIRLMGNCYEIRAQMHLQQKNFKQTKEDLNEASRIFSAEQTFDQFFVYKWKTVLKALEEQDVSGIDVLRAEAFYRKDYESVREADLFRLQIKFNSKLFNQLYFGTPFESYRQRIAAILNCTPQENNFIYGEKPEHILDLSTGDIPSAQINRGKLIHKTLVALLRDLYRPLRVGGLFAEIYPDEKFDIYSSPRKVHHLQFRLRQWFTENSIPASLEELNGTYALRFQPGFGVKLSLKTESVSGWLPEWTRLSLALQDRNSVTPIEVRNLLNLKLSSSKRFLKWATEVGYLRREGENNKIIYTRAA